MLEEEGRVHSIPLSLEWYVSIAAAAVGNATLLQDTLDFLAKLVELPYMEYLYLDLLCAAATNAKL
jgi:hypothetical protein